MILRLTRRSSSQLIREKVEMEEARRGPIVVTRRVRIRNTKSNSKSIRKQMEILRVTMGFNLLTEIGFASVTRVVGFIPHTPLAYIIHGPLVCKIINPSPCLLPLSFKLNGNSEWRSSTGCF